MYRQVYNYQEPTGILVSQLAARPNKIKQLLDGFLKFDPFLERLVKVSQDFNAIALSADASTRKKVQHIQMCVLRCDFMIDVPSNSVKMVEYNTIASSFGILSQKVLEVQDYIRNKYGKDLNYCYEKIDPNTNEELTPEDKVIVDYANNKQRSYIDNMVSNFKQAITLYKQSQKEKFGAEPEDPWVLFVVEEKERNVVDQKIIEVQLQLQTGIKSMRVTFKDVLENQQMDENNVLRVFGKEIGFVYYRTGYQVEQYANEGDWQARTLLELSQAVKCPSIDYHLTTFKKFQQSFCDSNVMQEVMQNSGCSEHHQNLLNSLFSGIWSLEDYDSNTEVQDIVKKAIENPHSYVVKPQKEGGGNNFYDDDARDLLQKFINPETEVPVRENLKQYLIMERIYPPMVKVFMLRDGNLLEINSLSELGLFSLLFIDSSKEPGEQILVNKNFGTLMRTKGSHSNEGGVNSGYSVIDIPILYVNKEEKLPEQLPEQIQANW